MKIGILTFHSQLNYGGVLQAYALQTALTQLGHHVVIIDRWIDPKNTALNGVYQSFSLKRWIGFVLRGILGCGTFGRFVRHQRTRQFVRNHLQLSSYHFYEWKDMVGRDLGVDCVVVGSDQVWHCGDWGDPLPYLLKDAPIGARVISYAASFGMSKIPSAFVSEFQHGLNKFSAISVREKEGVGIIQSLGFSATHVVDPTQLLDPGSGWQFVKKEACFQSKKSLFCYFLSENTEASLDVLERFARENKVRVNVYVDRCVLSFPKSVKQLTVRVLWLLSLRYRRVKIHVSAGPKEFLSGLNNATWVISDSFHALMFSSIFKKNVRILKPEQRTRIKMFARIEEFVQTNVNQGNLIASNLQEALQSLIHDTPIQFNEEAMKQVRQDSLQWLTKTLSKVTFDNP